MEPTAPVTRRRFRLSVRALMAVILVIAVALGWYLETVRNQQKAVAAIRQAGGSVTYDWDWGNHDPNITSYGGKPRAPKWLSDRLSADYVANVDHVSLMPRKGMIINDQTLEAVAGFGHVVSLWLNGAAVTDAGMVHFKGLGRLSDLNLGNTKVTDAGLAQLAGLTNLRTLFLVGSPVTDAGVLALEEALPRLQILREDNVAITTNRPRAMNDLAFAKSLPPRTAGPVLIDRAKAMIGRGDMAELIATIDAICGLESDNILDLVKIGEARGECLGILEPTFSPKLPASERQALVKRCGDRGIDALTLAVERGYNNIRRLDGDLWETLMIGNLRHQPGYPRLIQIMKARRAGSQAAR
jgi:hypothetical protein